MVQGTPLFIALALRTAKDVLRMTYLPNLDLFTVSEISVNSLSAFSCSIFSFLLTEAGAFFFFFELGQPFLCSAFYQCLKVPGSHIFQMILGMEIQNRSLEVRRSITIVGFSRLSKISLVCISRMFMVCFWWLDCYAAWSREYYICEENVKEKNVGTPTFPAAPSWCLCYCDSVI